MRDNSEWCSTGPERAVLHRLYMLHTSSLLVKINLATLKALASDLATVVKLNDHRWRTQASYRIGTGARLPHAQRRELWLIIVAGKHFKFEVRK